MARISFALFLTLIQFNFALQDRILPTFQTAGNSLEIQCTLSSPQSWELTRLNTTSTPIVTRNATAYYYCVGSFSSLDTTDRCRTGISMNHTTGMTIKFDTLQLTDAGQYECIYNSSTSEKHLVTVVETSSPQMTLFINGTNVSETSSTFITTVSAHAALSFTCHLVFSGFVQPALSMFLFNSNGAKSILASSVENNTNEYRTEQMVELTGNYIVAENDELLNITCQMDGHSFRLSSTDIVLKTVRYTDSMPTFNDPTIIAIVATLFGAALLVFIVLFIVTCIRRHEMQCLGKGGKRGKASYPRTKIPEIIITDVTAKPVPPMGASSSSYISTAAANAETIPTIDELVRLEYRANQEDDDEDGSSEHHTAMRLSNRQQHSEAFTDIGGGIGGAGGAGRDGVGREITVVEPSEDSADNSAIAINTVTVPVVRKKYIESLVY